MTEFRGRGKERWLVASVVTLASLFLAACGPAKSTTPSSTTHLTVPASTSTSTTTTLASTSTTAMAGIAPYLALWPFNTVSDVESWQQAYRSVGHQPWHLDAGSTALDFTESYLGYRDVNVVVGTTIDVTGAHVAMGFHPTNGPTSTAAVVHLVRWGTNSDAPWEVVGTDDTTFSLTTPPYGATVSSPLRVGGTITGVDESISVTVHQGTSSTAIGSFCCLPAGGAAAPWSATVRFAGETAPVLTVAAATGGHVQTVERFTVTGVHSVTG